MRKHSRRADRQPVPTELSASSPLGAIAVRRQDCPQADPPARRFVTRFPFFPTPDQASVTEDVLGDLASGRPMDRLVCGDVGFGKTEVALRAAAAAVLSGAQFAIVAILLSQLDIDDR
jgi:transcription-repair coupling factor (superfamily II helicase)